MLSQFNPQMKILWHLDRINEWLKTGDTTPITLEVDLSNACNHNCPWCTFKYIKNKDILSWPLTKKLLDGAKELNVKGITYTGGGEPFMNPIIYDVLKYTKSIGLESGIYTNAALLKDVDTIIKNCQWIRISLDAATEKTYAITHGSKRNDFNIVINNIKELVKRKKELKSDIVIGVGMLIFYNNYKEIIKFAKLCKNLGVDYIQYKPVIYSAWEKKQLEDKWIKKKIIPRILKAEQLTDNTFKVVLTQYKFNDLLTGKQYGRDYKTCYAHYVMGAIGADGKVYICEHLKGFDACVLGDLHNNTLFEIWNSEQRKKVIKEMNFKRCMALCKNHEVNKMLWHLKNVKKEMHPNFL